DFPQLGNRQADKQVAFGVFAFARFEKPLTEFGSLQISTHFHLFTNLFYAHKWLQHLNRLYRHFRFFITALMTPTAPRLQQSPFFFSFYTQVQAIIRLFHHHKPAKLSLSTK